MNMPLIDWELVVSNKTLIVEGLLFSLKLTLIASVIGMIGGAFLAMARLSSIKPLSFLASAYVNLFRSVPLLLVLFWFFFLLPFFGVRLDVGNIAIVTFSVFEAAYFCEIIRAGIQSISRGQVSAASALGLTYGQTMALIVLPQAFRNMLPVLVTQIVILFQDTSLTSVIGVYDFFHSAEVVGKNNGALPPMIMFVAVIYFGICFSISMAARTLLKRYAVLR